MTHQPQVTRRFVSEGAENWLYREVPVLDHGNVMLVDYMGNDNSIEHAARVSYGEGTRKLSETRGLLRYLLRHDHTTPFEMVEVKFAARMPLFVARQWVRHRTANINEYSARYSQVRDTFYVPEDDVIQAQSADNKQGRGQQADPQVRAEFKSRLIKFSQDAYQAYQEMLEQGVARELARAVLPLNFYTEWYWKIDLHNLMHFLWLRLDSHAQYEVRVYAQAMAKIVQDAFPIAWQAFVDYKLEAVKLTRLEAETIRSSYLGIGLDEIAGQLQASGLHNQRERIEAVDKLFQLKLISPPTAQEIDEYLNAFGLSERQRVREIAGLQSAGITDPEDE